MVTNKKRFRVVLAGGEARGARLFSNRVPGPGFSGNRQRAHALMLCGLRPESQASGIAGGR